MRNRGLGSWPRRRARMSPRRVALIHDDVPCTYALGFRLRQGRLNMSVHMRSQDLFWGFGNDLPCFSLFHELVAAILGADVGLYCPSVDSLHVYERHWDDLQQIVRGSPWSPVDPPEIQHDEAVALLRREPATRDPFTAWLSQDDGADEPRP